MDSFSTATATAFVLYLTFSGTARRCGNFHYWRNATNSYLFLVLYKISRVFFNRLLESLCKNSFCFSSNACLPSSILKEHRRNIQKQPLGDVLLKKVFFCATSPWCGHWLTCFAQKGYSYLRLFFPHIILPQIRTGSFSSESAILVQ